MTDLPHHPKEMVMKRLGVGSIVLWHHEDASQDQLSHPGEIADLQVEKSWKRDA